MSQFQILVLSEFAVLLTIIYFNTRDQSTVVMWTALAAFGTIAVAIIAIFQDQIRASIYHPELKLHVSLANPDCEKISMPVKGLPSTRADWYFFRLKIRNEGNQRANKVEVFADNLRKESETGIPKKVRHFLPMNLLWCHIRQPLMDTISQGMEKHFDLGHIIYPSNRKDWLGEDASLIEVPGNQPVFSLDVEVRAVPRQYLIPPGKYYLDLIVSAENAEPKLQTLNIDISEKWYNDENEMFSKGISLRAT